MIIRYERVHPDAGCPEFIAQGDWVDLKIPEETSLSIGEFKAISLGIRFALPRGFEAWVAPRSSTGKKYGVLQYNSPGICDESYRGPEDIWHALFYATRNTTIPKGAKVAQFRIMPKMNSGIFPRLRWLFTRKIKFVEGIDKKYTNRGGLGSTGV